MTNTSNKILIVGHHWTFDINHPLCKLLTRNGFDVTITEKLHTLYNRIDITDDMCQNYDIIVVSPYFESINLSNDLLNKCILFINEPIHKYNRIMFDMYTNNKCRLSLGCVPNNINNIKFPYYMEWGINIQKILDSNDYIKNITYDDFIKKKFASLISRHDKGNTRKNILTHMSQFGTIVCPSKFTNNFSNEEFEKIGRDIFQKQFIFSICPENFIIELDGYITEKLWMACYCGNIPIYYGKLDEYDKKIFNVNRIIQFDPTSRKSIKDASMFVKDLMTDKNKLFEFYKQPPLCDTAIDTIQFLENEAIRKIQEFK